MERLRPGRRGDSTSSCPAEPLTRFLVSSSCPSIVFTRKWHQVRSLTRYEGKSKMRANFVRANHNHVCPSTNTRSVAYRHAPTLWLRRFQIVKNHEQSAVQDPVDALINVLYSQILTQNQIEDPWARILQQLPMPWQRPLSEALRFYWLSPIFLCPPLFSRTHSRFFHFLWSFHPRTENNYRFQQ